MRQPGAGLRRNGWLLVCLAVAGLAFAWLVAAGGSASLASGGPTTPKIKTVSPKKGPAAGGTTVMITGVGFVEVTGVTFGGVEATSVKVNSSGSITVTAPPGTTGSAEVIVATSSGPSATDHKTHFNYERPTVTGLSPERGAVAGGTSVTVTGSGFAPGSNTTVFRFGKFTSTSVTCASSTSCTVITPANKPHSVDVRARVGKISSKKARPADLFAYVPVPTVKKVLPKGGPAAGGTAVTIAGKAFIDVESVRFGSTSVSYDVVSPTEITATTPPGTSGKQPLVVTTGSGVNKLTAKSAFKYGPPTITEVDPAQGPVGGGNTVTISGSGFAVGTNTTSFRFGKITSSTVDCSSPTTCTAVAPAESPRTVNVRATVGKKSSHKNKPTDDYTFIPAPAVKKLASNTGTPEGGTPVMISGADFSEVSAVHFGSTSVAYTVMNSSTITVTSPPGSGNVEITVTTASGTSAPTRKSTFHYH